jgi:hypothetical protein
MVVPIFEHVQWRLALDDRPARCPGESDPYAKVFFNGKLVGRTKVMQSTSRLHESTFSRTVWRIYGGAKGLAVWY